MTSLIMYAVYVRHMGCQLLLPKSVTLNHLELRNDHYFALFYRLRQIVCRQTKRPIVCNNKKLIRRWDSKRELPYGWHRTRTTKYNRLVHKFLHRSTPLCVGTQVYQNQLNNTMQTAITPFKVIQGHRFWYQSKAHDRDPWLWITYC